MILIWSLLPFSELDNDFNKFIAYSQKFVFNIRILSISVSLYDINILVNDEIELYFI